MMNNNNKRGMFEGLLSNPSPVSQGHESSRSITAGMGDELTDLEMEIAELERKIINDKQRLKRLREMAKIRRLGRQPGLEVLEGHELLSRRMMYEAQDGVLKYISKATEKCNAQGFVYGIVYENGKTLSGTSDSLREWWKDKVRFDRNGPSAIIKHHLEMNSSDGSELGFEGGESTAIKLLELQDTTLGALLSSLYPHCRPPQRKFPLDKGVTPPWWPTGNEEWWDDVGLSDDCRGLPPPYKKPHDLKKVWKVGVLIGVIRHMGLDIGNIPQLVKRSRSLQEKMSSREGSLWLAALSREKAIYENTYGTSLIFRGNNNDNTCSFLVPGSSSGDTDALFPEAADYDVEGIVGTHEFDNIILNGVNSSKRKLVGDFGMSLQQAKLTCENSLCPHSKPHMGFHDRSIREHHQMNCPYRVIPFNQPFVIPGQRLPHPVYNRSFHGVETENQPVGMQEQVDSVQDQFNQLNRLNATQRGGGGGNNEYQFDHQVDDIVEALSRGRSLMNHNAGFDFSGNVVGTVGIMENNVENQVEEELPTFWHD